MAPQSTVPGRVFHADYRGDVGRDGRACQAAREGEARSKSSFPKGLHLRLEPVAQSSSGMGFTVEEAKMYWRELTNMAFTVTGHFEPQECLSIVAGRPVVATRGNIASTPHVPTVFCGCDSPVKPMRVITQ